MFRTRHSDPDAKKCLESLAEHPQGAKTFIIARDVVMLRDKAEGILGRLEKDGMVQREGDLWKPVKI